MKTYFYIIKRDGHIIEIENIGDRFSSSLEQLQKGGVVVFANLGIAINTVDISDILNEERYDGYVDSAQPKLFIKNGVWRDIKERKVVRYENWKEEEIEANRRPEIEAPKDEEMTKEEQERYHKFMKEKFDKFRPTWMKKQAIIPPHDPELTANAILPDNF